MRKCDVDLPEPNLLKERMRRLAALDLILCEEDWLCVHQYMPDWAEGVEVGKIDNGAGDDLFVVFAQGGVIVKGFDHESPYSPHAQDEYGVWPGMYEQVPEALLPYVQDEALSTEDVTFCYWRDQGDEHWYSGEYERPEGLDDGSDFLLGYLNDTADSYAEWANSYFEVEVDLPAVRQLIEGGRTSAANIAKLNPERNIEDVLGQLIKLGVTIE
jgi:hypothetical protein